MRKILVTGASGFLGSRLVRRLVERNLPIKLLVRPGSSLAAIDGVPPETCEMVRGDITIEGQVYTVEQLGVLNQLVKMKQ